jgi:hypothetical protein
VIPSAAALLFSIRQGQVYNAEQIKIGDFRPFKIRGKTKKNPKNVQKKAENTRKTLKTAIIAVGWPFEKICALTFNVLGAETFTS